MLSKYIKLQTNKHNCYMTILKRTISVKNRTISVKNRTVSVIFGGVIPYKRARVIELWNIEMLHQGYRRRLKNAVFRVLALSENFKKSV